MATSNFRILNPVLANTREISEVLNLTVGGKLNCTGDFTVTANAGTTTVTDPRASKESVILFSPTTSNAATEVNHLYVSTKNNGSFVVGHRNNGQSDRDFDYVIIG